MTDLRHPDALVNDLAASLGGRNSCGYGTTGQFLLAAPAAKAEFLKKVKTIVLALDEKKGNRRATATELKGDSLIFYWGGTDVAGSGLPERDYGHACLIEAALRNPDWFPVFAHEWSRRH